jgi:hypothetical protein
MSDVRLTVVMRRQWDEVLWRTAESTPAGSRSLLLEWRAEPEPVDSGAPREVAEVLARVMTEMGEVAFRWSGEAVWPEGAARVLPAPERNLLARAADWLRTSWPADVVVTRSAAAAAHLFEHEWELQGQVALALDPDAGSPAAALEALRERRDWRSFVLAPPVVALLAPAVDGDGALLSVGSQAGLEEAARRLGRAFGERGIGFREA